jgi:hypothetical protein
MLDRTELGLQATMSYSAERLRNIKTFDDLIHYLEDELDWPLADYGFDDLTFEYTPEELGLKDEEAAKVRTIHQLRPLRDGQVWGIFFVEFEHKRLPVVVLRRILSHLVLKKRASAKQAQAAAWYLHDLLFITAFGDECNGEIGFAHFHQDTGDLPTLRVMGWDGADTPLKLEYVADTLKRKLHWPDDVNDVDTWREQWASAFRHRVGHVIRTADALVETLAALARSIRDAALTLLQLESEKGPLCQLLKAFQTALIHDLTEESFADTYAQTITYGLLTAAISRTEKSEGRYGTILLADNVADMVPVTNPFLKEMLQTFLTVGGRKGRIDFDELGIQDVVELLRGEETDLPAVLRDFGNRRRGEDPVIHFYEHFLSAYNKKLKVQRGVFYTPQPVVSYIVRSVHKLLQTEFGLEDGLAATTTWAEMANKHPDLKIPDSVPPESPFVQILDPATGTATFLVEVIEVVYRTLMAKWQAQRLSEQQCDEMWNEYVPRHLLPRLHGYELMMAPYAIAHMKIGLKLYETGYRFQSDERVRVYLTNALEPPSDVQKKLEGILPALAHEAQAVNAIKRNQRFTVVVGNPPYAGVSANMSEAASDLIEPYKFVDGKPLGERKHWLQDDYVKFIRLAQLAIGGTGIGILSYITNHGYLDNPTFRGMRQNLMKSFSNIYILDLHGSVKKRDEATLTKRDENVFDIEQGVAISVFSRPLKLLDSASVYYTILLGPRSVKYEWLLSHALVNQSQTSPSSPYYFFVKREETHREEYETLTPITSIFQVYSTGIQTSRDSFAIAPTSRELEKRLQEFLAQSVREDQLKDTYGLKDMDFWQIAEVRHNFRRVAQPYQYIKPIDYRPFDTQHVIFHKMIIHRPKEKIMRHMLAGENLALLLPRQLASGNFHHVFCTRNLAEMCVISTKTTEQNNLFPMYLYNQKGDLELSVTETKKQHVARTPNLAGSFLKAIAGRFKLQFGFGSEVPIGITPEDIFRYVYAVFHSPTYRTRYAEFLKIDFPRIPLTSNLGLFRKLAALGGELVALHLMESPELDQHLTTYIGPTDPIVEKVSYAQDTVWLDKAKTRGFRSVPENVWNFYIGGYQVCNKWLKDRKGRTLSADDLTHYHRIVVALHETIHLMAEIDAVIEQHGGWPIK